MPQQKDSEPLITMPLNETKLHIETTLASVGYAERMIRLADQFHREGNQAATNGAFMMAWDIRENTKDAMDILPNLTPEHAALLGQSERQRLSSELNSSYENLNRLGARVRLYRGPVGRMLRTGSRMVRVLFRGRPCGPLGRRHNGPCGEPAGK